VTFAGIEETYAPAAVVGVLKVIDQNGQVLATRKCGSALCILVEGGSTYQLVWSE
jgi:hypothetical protein